MTMVICSVLRTCFVMLATLLVTFQTHSIGPPNSLAQLVLRYSVRVLRTLSPTPCNIQPPNPCSLAPALVDRPSSGMSSVVSSSFGGRTRLTLIDSSPVPSDSAIPCVASKEQQLRLLASCTVRIVLVPSEQFRGDWPHSALIVLRFVELEFRWSNSMNAWILFIDVIIQ